MHDSGALQSIAARHWGAASPGVTQRPVMQMTAAPHAQQSALEAHSVRQTALMHTWGDAQSALARHCNRGRSSAWHMPILHRSSGPQSESAVHAAKQVPFMQTFPVGAQSLLRIHCPADTGLV